MAEPTRYLPGFNYSGWEADHPTEPKPGAELDNDFANIERSIGETIDALGDIRRSDGAMNNGVVTLDALHTSVKAAIASDEYDYEALEDLLRKDANLSDVADATTARDNLGVLARSSNLADVENAATARANIDAASATDFQNSRTFETVADVEAATIPAAVDVIRTAGYYSPGDGGGALYKRVESEPNHAGNIQSADGAWWALSGPTVNVCQFGAAGDGTTDDSDAIEDACDYALSIGGSVLVPARGIFVVSRVIEALCPIRFDGLIKCGTDPETAGIKLMGQPLRIENYLRIYCDGDPDNISASEEPVNASAHTAALQAACNDLAANRGFTHLDLQGRKLWLNGPVTIDSSLTPDNDTSLRHRVIHDGTLHALEGATDDFMLIHDRLSGGALPSSLTVSRVNFLCFDRMSGIGFPITASYVYILGCRIIRPTQYGIWMPSDGGGVQISDTSLIANGAIDMMDRESIGIYYGGSDLQISGCFVRMFKHQLWMEGGAQNIVTNTHFTSGPGPFEGRRPGLVVLNNQRSATFVNCYFDGSPVLCKRDDGAATIGFFQIVGSLFTIGNAVDETVYNFIELETGPDSAGASPRDIIIVGNRFNRVGGPSLTHPFRSRGNTINNSNASGVFIHSNTFNNCQVMASQLERHGTMPFSNNEWDHNVLDYRPFGINFRRVRSVGLVADADPGHVWVENMGNSQFRVHVANSVSGRAHLVLDVNEVNQTGL